MTKTKHDTPKYTCTDYRSEMILLGLNRRLREEGIDRREEEELRRQIKRVEIEMGMD